MAILQSSERQKKKSYHNRKFNNTAKKTWFNFLNVCIAKLLFEIIIIAALKKLYKQTFKTQTGAFQDLINYEDNALERSDILLRVPVKTAVVLDDLSSSTRDSRHISIRSAALRPLPTRIVRSRYFLAIAVPIIIVASSISGAPLSSRNIERAFFACSGLRVSVSLLHVQLYF